MFNFLTATELDAYINLCERNMEFLAMQRRLNPTDRVINKDYNQMLSLRKRLYTEANKRLKELIEKENEPTEKTIQQD